MNERERAANTSAEFHSDDLGTLIGAEGDREGALPAIKVAGVLTFAYVEDGAMYVSVDLDDAGEYWPEGYTVPLRITVNGVTVYQAASEPDPAPEPWPGYENDQRLLRKFTTGDEMKERVSMGRGGNVTQITLPGSPSLYTT